jgi:hypothetical protein
VAAAVSGLATDPDRRLLYVVVAAADERLYDRLEKATARGRGAPVVFLRGGVAGYERLLREQVAVWTRPPRRTGAGAPCPTCR